MKKAFKISLGILAVLVIIIMSSIFITNLDTIRNKEGEKLATTETTGKEDKKIITTSEIQFSWDKDPNEIYNIIDNDSYIIKVKINKIQEAVMLEEKNGVKHTIPLKPVSATVIENIKGNTNNSEVNFYVPGGEVSVLEMIKTMNEAQIEKIGYDKLTKEEKSNSYIKYYSESDFDIKEDEEYIVILNKSRDGNYYLSCNGYGVFKEIQSDIRTQSNDNTIKLRNCLTEKEASYTKE